MKHSVAFLLDADNTLLNNDRILADFMGHIEQTVGHQGKQRYWAIFEELRDELGYPSPTATWCSSLERWSSPAWRRPPAATC